MIYSIISKLLRQTADDIDSGKYQCSDEELETALDSIGKFNQYRELSKEQACKYLNLTRSTFDTYVRSGWIPKGQKRLGFKELSWRKCDLDTSCDKIRKILNS